MVAVVENATRCFESEKVFDTVPRFGTHSFLRYTFREIADLRPSETLDQTHILGASLQNKINFEHARSRGLAV